MRTVFIGSIEFSWSCLKEILDKKLTDIVGIFNVDPKYSQNISDYKNQKDLAQKYEIPHYFFKNINDSMTVEKLKELRPDLILVFGLSQIIKKAILDIPSLGLVGTHPALLPKNRGRAAIPWSIIKGLKESGLTIFYLGEDADMGDIIDQIKWKITISDDARSIYNKMIVGGKKLLYRNLPLLEKGKAGRIKQPKKSNWWPARTKEDGKINWGYSSDKIERLIRATTWPYPGAFTSFKNKRLIIWKGTSIKNVNRYPRPKGRGSLISLPAGRQVAQDSLHPRDESRGFFAQNKTKPGTLIKRDRYGLLIKVRDGAILAKIFEPKNIKIYEGDLLE